MEWSQVDPPFQKECCLLSKDTEHILHKAHAHNLNTRTTHQQYETKDPIDNFKNLTINDIVTAKNKYASLTVSIFTIVYYLSRILSSYFYGNDIGEAK